MPVRDALVLATRLAAWLAFGVMTVALLTDHGRVFSFSVMAYALALLLYEHCLRRRTKRDGKTIDEDQPREPPNRS